MCGITGLFNFITDLPVSYDLLKNMTNALSHRGPDDEGIYIDPGHTIGLGHRRLSIIDIKTGHQPMSNAEGTIWIVFNGEIYNFLELRKYVRNLGYECRTNSDTEVIIHLFDAFGTEAFSRLNGIFALAIYDKAKHQLILARDCFGIKPLYYYSDNTALRFGSEIKALFQDPAIARQMDFEALNTFFTLRFNPSPQTLFKEIKKLEPGHYLVVDGCGASKSKPYTACVAKTDIKISEIEATEKYQYLLEQAVKRQMISDVPLGLFLSGGIDSAVIGSLMKKNSHNNLKTFTIGFEGAGDFNELDDARATARHIGSEHFDLILERKSYLNFFLRSFFYTEEPISETTIPALYYVSKLASEHVKVVLAGQGADEPLAGYKRYVGEHYLNKYASLLRALPLDLIMKLIPRNERLKRAAFAAQYKEEVTRFLAIYTIFTPEMKAGLFNDDTKRQISDSNSELIERIYCRTSKLNDSLSRLLFIDTRLHLPDNLLLFGDKISMANSLEMRVPFLDIELVKFLESLPAHFKLKGTKQKILHKNAVKRWLPDEIIYRKKRGFQTPMDEWLQADLAEGARIIFNHKESVCRRYFNLEFVNRLLDLHKMRKENYQRQLFLLLSFELWHRNFFDNRSGAIYGEELLSINGSR